MKKLLFILISSLLLTSQVYAQKSPTPAELAGMMEQEELINKYCNDSIMYESEATRDEKKARELARQCKENAGMKACLARFGGYCE